VAALVNPAGPGDEGESVLLLNASPDPIDLTGWQIADKTKEKCPVPSSPLAAGKTLEVPIAKPCALSNNGGIITLLDATGTKVSGVSYTKEQAQEQGWTVTF
ncbi:MAG: lamin tail domain-containing protein, partial [Solirubrobacterales bacterium]